MNAEVEAYLQLMRNDIGSARSLLSEYPGNAAFFVEQAAEKLIKAVLAREGIRERVRHHRLGPLVALLPKSNPWRGELTELEWLSSAATVFRYPGADGNVPAPPDAAEYAAAIDRIEHLAIRIEDWCRAE
jgi:HEPN domain-containing protein